MASFECEHRDPAALARAAAVRSRTERDPQTRAREREMTMAERLQAGFELSRVASRLLGRARR